MDLTGAHKILSNWNADHPGPIYTRFALLDRCISILLDLPPPALPLLSPQVEICEGWYRLSKESEYKDKKIIERQQSSGKERDF